MSQSPGADPNVPPTQVVPPQPAHRGSADGLTQVVPAVTTGTARVLPAHGGAAARAAQVTDATQVLSTGQATQVLPATEAPPTPVPSAASQPTHVLPAAEATQVLPAGDVEPAEATAVVPTPGDAPTQVVPAYEVDSWLPAEATQVLSAHGADTTRLLPAQEPTAPAEVRRTPVLPPNPTAVYPVDQGGGYPSAASPGSAASPSAPRRTPPPAPRAAYPTAAPARPLPPAPPSWQASSAATAPGGRAGQQTSWQAAGSATPTAQPADASGRHPGYGGPSAAPARPTSPPEQAAPRPAAPGPAPRQEVEQRRGRGTEPTAVAAMMAAVVGILVPFVGILAIILGGVGADRARRRGTGGRGMARTATVLGSIQVVVTTILLVGGLVLWNAVADDLRRGIEQVEGVTMPELSLPDLALDGLTGEWTFDDVSELVGSVGQVGELGDLANRCQSGDVGACDGLVGKLPDGLLSTP